jgi:hypothetical protein
MIILPDARKHDRRFLPYDLPRNPAPLGSGSFFLHTLSAMLGGGFCACFLHLLLMRTGLLASDPNLLLWYSPLTWWPGLLLGFAAGRRERNSHAGLVWLSGALTLGALTVILFWTNHNWERTLADLFPLSTADHSPDDELGLCQLFFVWPAVNAFAYSLGASLASLLAARHRQRHRDRILHW